MENAKQSRTGYEEGIRNGFRQLSTSKNGLRGFSTIERAAIRAVGEGSSVEGILRLLGKAAPTGIVSTVLSGGAGAALGGGPGAIAMMGVGQAAKKSADSLVRNRAEAAAALVRTSREAQKALPKPNQVNQGRIDQTLGTGLLSISPLLARR